jgi:predicted transcriptional regulator
MKSSSIDPVVDALKALGLSRLEAALYVELARRAVPMTGYELAKATAVARANVYDALRALVRSGAVWTSAEAGATRYLARPFAEWAQDLRRAWDERVGQVQAALSGDGQPGTGTWQAVGWSAFVSAVESAAATVEQSVIIGASAAPVQRLAPVVARLEAAHVPLQFGCWDACPGEGCGVCRSPWRHLRPTTARWPTVVVVDRRQAVVTTGSESDATVMTTDQPVVVEALATLVTAD